MEKRFKKEGCNIFFWKFHKEEKREGTGRRIKIYRYKYELHIKVVLGALLFLSLIFNPLGKGAFFATVFAVILIIAWGAMSDELVYDPGADILKDYISYRSKGMLKSWWDKES